MIALPWIFAWNEFYPFILRERDAFLGIVMSLNEDIKGLLAREALKWVLGCSQLPTTAGLICNAFA